jgi:tetratricopeptide (TPR) repeat protein
MTIANVRTIKIDPSEYTAWYGRGNAFLNLGKYKKSIYNFDRALEIQPNATKIPNSQLTRFNRLSISDQMQISQNWQISFQIC